MAKAQRMWREDLSRTLILIETDQWISPAMSTRLLYPSQAPAGIPTVSQDPPMTPPIPAPKPAHLSLLTFPRLPPIHSIEASPLDYDSGQQTSQAFAASREARSLYSFTALNSNELSFAANASLIIHSASIGEGWSMACVAATGQVGLCPASYWVYTSGFELSPDLYSGGSWESKAKGEKRASSDLVDEHRESGWEWIRKSVLGGRSLNRFSKFVQSGAEDFILSGSTPTASTSHARLPSNASLSHLVPESEIHHISSGPSWTNKSAIFQTSIGSTKRRGDLGGGEYITYEILSVFPSEENDKDVRIEVSRRYSSFALLCQWLCTKYRALAIEPLPGKASDVNIENRRRDLDSWLRRVVRHPVLRYSEGLIAFLGSDTEEEWKSRSAELMKDSSTPSTFFSQIYHPEFNVDLEDSSTTIERFEKHLQALDISITSLRTLWPSVRARMHENGRADRELAQGFWKMMQEQNAQGVWCWREHCGGELTGLTPRWRAYDKAGCLQLTRGMSGLVQSLTDVANLREEQAGKELMDVQDRLKDLAYPSLLYSSVVDIHKATLGRYSSSTQSIETESELISSRCETILNSTLSEIDHYHDTKTADIRALLSTYLDSEITTHEKILDRLREARTALDAPIGDDVECHVPPCELREQVPLDQPDAHPWDGGVSMLLSRLKL
ncbi:sorting nexin-9/18/33, partial [Tremellales sp. Uapishka_1]